MKNTAFIVIHGMGAHRPFETVDAFIRGFWNLLQKENPGLKFKWDHKLLRHQDWIENYISITPDNMSSLEFYEYYWDCYMVREITSDELVKWLDQVSGGARKFYQENPEIARRHREEGVSLFRDDDLKLINYTRHIITNIRWLKWLGPLLNTIPVMRMLKPVVAKWMRNFMQDVVIYTSSDVRSQNYIIRQQILRGAVEEIKLLLATRDCRIILAGHSLGSVIAYDALNRINLEMNTKGGLSPALAARIGGLVSFGSPLDKIYFFFKEPTTEEQYVQRHILSHFHGYKKKPAATRNDLTVGNPIKNLLDNSVWLNFYHLKDPVSGSLDAYQVDRNIECKFDAEFMEAHSCYWPYEDMYRDIAGHFF